VIANLLALAASAVPGPSTSPLSEANHRHEWILLAEDEDHRQWLDIGRIGQTQINDEIYPTVIFRSQIVSKSGKPNILDSEHAVHCSTIQSASAMLRVWNGGPRWGGFDSPPQKVHDVEFLTLLRPTVPRDSEILKLACPDLFEDQ